MAVRLLPHSIKSYILYLTMGTIYSNTCSNKEDPVSLSKGDCKMDTHEIELMNLIYENENPEQAVLTAIKVFAAFLEQLAADPEPQAVFPLESA